MWCHESLILATTTNCIINFNVNVKVFKSRKLLITSILQETKTKKTSALVLLSDMICPFLVQGSENTMFFFFFYHYCQNYLHFFSMTYKLELLIFKVVQYIPLRCH